MSNGNETGSSYKVGKGKPPIETRFSTERQPEKNGRPKGSKNLGTIVRSILEGDVELPPAIAETIKTAIRR